MILLGGSGEDLRVFTSETSNAKAKSSENFLSPDQNGPNFFGFGGLVIRRYKNFQFLLQKAHPCPNPRRLSHFAWRSVEGSDPQGSCWKKRESHRSSHWNDVSPLTQGCTPVRLWYTNESIKCWMGRFTARCTLMTDIMAQSPTAWRATIIKRFTQLHWVLGYFHEWWIIDE